MNLKDTDGELFEILNREIRREDETLELIASENFVSNSVLEMAGGVMTNKYAEGKGFRHSIIPSDCVCACRVVCLAWKPQLQE